MKKLALATMAFVIGLSSMAQTSDSASSGHKKFRKMEKHTGERDFEKLNLTDDQKAQVKKINESFREQMEKVNKNTGISADQLKEKRRALAKDHKQKINEILTPKQKKQMQDAHDQLTKEDKSGMRSRRFKEMTQDLNLTPEQSIKMKELSSALRNDVKSIRQNTSLSKEEKKEQMKNLMKKHKTDMEVLLSDEQKEQLRNRSKNRRTEAV